MTNKRKPGVNRRSKGNQTFFEVDILSRQKESEKPWAPFMS